MYFHRWLKRWFNLYDDFIREGSKFPPTIFHRAMFETWDSTWNGTWASPMMRSPFSVLTSTSVQSSKLLDGNAWLGYLVCGVASGMMYKGNECKICDSLSIVVIVARWFSMIFTLTWRAKGFWTTPLTRGWKNQDTPTFWFAMVCHLNIWGLWPHSAWRKVDPSLLTWQHASKEPGGSDGRGWRYGWWLQICTSACSILATCLRDREGWYLGHRSFGMWSFASQVLCTFRPPPRYTIGMLGRPLLFMGSEIGALKHWKHSEAALSNSVMY